MPSHPPLPTRPPRFESLLHIASTFDAIFPIHSAAAALFLFAMMYCLRSYIPLLLLPLPLSFSPFHLTLLLLTTYFLNRPCIYCSFLLLILFASSCHWSGRCFVDFSISSAGGIDGRGYGYAEWFTPRIYTIRSAKDSEVQLATADKVAGDAGMGEFLGAAVNHTISALAGAAFEEGRRRLAPTSLVASLPESAGIGLAWLRSLLGRSEWTVPCLDIKVRL